MNNDTLRRLARYADDYDLTIVSLSMLNDDDLVHEYRVTFANPSNTLTTALAYLVRRDVDNPNVDSDANADRMFDLTIDWANA